MNDTRTMRLEITQPDIDHGSHDIGDCPVALAFKRLLPHLPQLYVDWFGLYTSLGASPVLRFPPRLSDWISNYDVRGLQAHLPATFDVDIPVTLLPPEGQPA